jgi:hypothetical protein
MAAAKKAKLQKLIKSIDRKAAILSLCCEWHDCVYTDDTMTRFVEHVHNHINVDLANIDETQDKFVCYWRDCGHDGTFPSVVNLLRHVFFHAFHAKLKSIGSALSKQNSLVPCQLEASNRNTIPELPDQLVCKWKCCQGAFDDPEQYYNHVAQHADHYPSGNNVDGGCHCAWEGCSVCVKSKHRLKEHLRSHTQERVMACPTCGSLFANATKMFDHIQRQADANAHHYECSHCNKRCATERLLRDHMRQHVNHYRCPFCDKTCPNPSSLRTHVRYRHTEDRLYKCQSCDYWAKAAIDLRRHAETHDAESWIKCDVDGCSFRSRFLWEVNRHCRNIHEGVEPCKYVCHVCEKKYCRGMALTNHLRLKHLFKWPSGHTRFRYKRHDDGYYRLLTVSYESVDMKEQCILGGPTNPDLGEGFGSNGEPASNLSSIGLPTVSGFGDECGGVTGDGSDGGFVYLSNLELLGNVAVAMPRTDSASLVAATATATEELLPMCADGDNEDISPHALTGDDGEPSSITSSCGVAEVLSSSSLDFMHNGLTLPIRLRPDGVVEFSNNWQMKSLSRDIIINDSSCTSSPAYYLSFQDGSDSSGQQTQHSTHDPGWNPFKLVDETANSVGKEEEMLKVYSEDRWSGGVGGEHDAGMSSSSGGITLTLSFEAAVAAAESGLMFDPAVGEFVIDGNANLSSGIEKYSSGCNGSESSQYVFVDDGQLSG